MLDLKYICRSHSDVRVPDGVGLHLEREFVHTRKGGNSSWTSALINILALKTKMFAYPTKEQKNELMKSYVYLKVARNASDSAYFEKQEII